MKCYVLQSEIIPDSCRGIISTNVCVFMGIKLGLGTLFLFTTDLLQRTIKSTCSTSTRPSANIRQANGVLRLPLNVTFANWSHYLEPHIRGSATTQNKFVRKSRLGHKSLPKQVKIRLPFTSTDAPSLGMWQRSGCGLYLGCSGNSVCRQTELSH